MKKVILFIAVCLLMGTTSSYAQLTKEQRKEREELRKSSKSELNEKATKAARSEARQNAKDGWKTAPGALPLEKQLDRSYLMQMEYDADMYPKYIMAEGMSVGGNYDAAKMQALELAKQNLAGKILTEVTGLVNNSVENQQMEAEEAVSITRSVLTGKSFISQSLGRIITVVEAYRTCDDFGNPLPNKNKQVLVRIAYNGDMAKKVAKEAIRRDLEQRGDDLHNKLDELLGW